MKTQSKSLHSILGRARDSLAYDTEGVKLEFTEQIVSLMEAKGVSKSALAAHLNVAPAYVTKVLQGTTNFTLDSMVKIAHAFAAELHVQLKPMKSSVPLPSNTNGHAVRANGATRRHRESASA